MSTPSATHELIFPRVAELALVATIGDEPSADFTLLLKKHKLSQAEYQSLRAILQRAPTMAELGVFSAMWSEHCSYKSSRRHLSRFPTKGRAVVVGPGENAGVVRLSGKLCLAFKMESHNHPSYIEPYQGAATGVGGIMRDVFCMGARPVANLNALRFGERAHPRTAHLVANVVKGIGDYGNCVGVPTVGGSISFDASYNGNCLVNAMTVGTIHEDHIFKGYASGLGNLVVYVGSATGRDGIHGATMASDSFASQEAHQRTTVQVGDPFQEKLLLEATLEVLERGLVVGLQDMGAAGLTSSAFEMADRAGNGLFLDLDRVPVRTSAMSAYELLLSESQERMLMVVEPARWPELKAVLDRWLLAGAVIGEVTDSGRVQIHHRGQLEVDIPVAPLTEQAPRYERPLKPRQLSSPLAAATFDAHVAERVQKEGGGAAALLALLAETGDKGPLYRQFDHHIGTQTVRGPDGQGAALLWMRSPWADPGEPWLGVALAAQCNERYCRLDPRQGASHAVLRCARAVAAVGGEPLAITDCLNYGNPEDPEVMWEFSEGVDGIADACRALDIAVVSGNVSLYNETDGQSIAPTPMIGMVAKVVDVRKAPSAVLREPSELYLLHPKGTRPSFAGSRLAELGKAPMRGGALAALDWTGEREAIEWLRAWIGGGELAVCRDVGEGGVVTTVAKMVLASQGLGFELDLGRLELASDEPLVRAFGELGASYVVAFGSPEVARRAKVSVEASAGVMTLGAIGQARESPDLRWDGNVLAGQLARDAFQAAYPL